MLNEAEHLVCIAVLVVVPGNYFDELIGEGDTCFGVEDRGAGIREEVGGDNGLVGVTENALELVFGSFLHCGADLFVLCGLLEVDGEVNNADVQSGNAHSHTGELAVELGDDLADSLGGAGGGGDDVACCCTAAAPVLNGNAVEDLLTGSGGVNSGHEAFHDAELLVENLGNGSKAVGGAGSVGDESHVLGVLVEVNTADEHGRSVLGGSAHDDLLGACVDVRLALFGSQVQTGALEDILSADFAPGQVSSILLAEAGVALAVDNKVISLVGNLAVELAVHGVILEQICKVVSGAEVVDADDLDVGMVHAVAEYHAADAAETIDTDFDFVHFN